MFLKKSGVCMADQRVVIVTGAGSGVGQAAAFLFAQEGCRVALVGRTASKLAQTQKLIELAMPEAKTLLVTADLQEPTAARAVVDKTVAAFGRIDVLANVAGQAPVTSIEQITPESWRACMDANVTHIALLTAAAWPVMKAQKGGVIVNVSSLAAFDPFPGFAMYAPAKAAVNMFTFCTAQEGASVGIKAVCVAPGAVETPMLRAIVGVDMLPRELTLTAGQVGRFIVDLALGKEAYKSGQTFMFPSPGAGEPGEGIRVEIATAKAAGK
jgi:NAD(P)-dependent dehydrogenase (short-subunit alcohol dehydrogenase family)